MAKKTTAEADAMKPEPGESHDDFMVRCEAEGNSTETCQLYWDEGTVAKVNKAQASREWDSDPNIRKSFSSKSRFVTVRAAELSGRLKISGGGSATRPA